jgi:aminoglycoside 2''-phosphotransferase
VDLAPLRRAVQEALPDLPLRTVEPLLEGWDNLVLDVNGEWILRFARRPETLAQWRRELALLPELATDFPVALPRYEILAWDRLEHPFVGYRKIPGAPLRAGDLAAAGSATLARDLAAILAALDRFPVARAAALLGIPDPTPAAWRAEYQALRGRIERVVLPHLGPEPAAATRALLDAFLESAANFAFEPCLVHRDLFGGNLLWDRGSGRVTGVLDWGDAGVGDPAIDLAGPLFCYGPSFADAVLAGTGHGSDPAFRARAAGYARLVPFHEALYALEVGEARLVDEALSDLGERLAASRGAPRSHR